MNNFYTLIYLIQEWKRRLQPSYFTEALSFRKNTLTLYFEKNTSDGHLSAVETSQQLTFSADPHRTALFIDRYAHPKRANAASFFPSLQGKPLLDIKLADDDRYIEFVFDGDQRLTFLLYGNKANVLLSSNGIIHEAFKRETMLQWAKLPLPQKAEGKEIASSDLSRIIFAKQPLLPRPLIRHYLRVQSPHISSNANGVELADWLDKEHRTGCYPHISDDYGFSILNPSLLQNSHATVFESVNDAVAKAFYLDVIAKEFTSRKIELSKRLQRAGEKLDRSLIELSRLPESLSKADDFEQIGHLLMANPHIRAESGVVEVQDFYNEGTIRTIPVDGSVSIIQNAERYYQKAKSTRLQYEASLGRISQLEQKKRTLIQLQGTLDALTYKRELDKWLKNHSEDLRKFGLSGGNDQQIAVPYRLVHFKGYEIKIGKSASANDELLRISHKEDIWLHARGVSGSHVIIGMNRSQAMPDMSVIETAAGYAAFFSKAKGSSLHPVIFTKRKFVRKPKGAAPGAVKVDKEQVVLVAPAEPQSTL